MIDITLQESRIEACENASIPVRTLTGEQARAIEPELSPQVKLAVQVPDATFDAWRLPFRAALRSRARSLCSGGAAV